MSSPNQTPADLRRFYEVDYERGFNVAGVPAEDDFMYGQVISQLRPYVRTGVDALDLGCNDGSLSLFMAARGCRVIGVDLARNIIETAQKSAEHHRIANARFQSMDFINEWETPDAFDLVLCSHVIEHVPDDLGFVRKIAYALRPGGVLVLLVPSVHSSLFRLSNLLTGRFKFDEEVGHLRRYSRRSLSDLVTEAGLEVKTTSFRDGILREWVFIPKPLRWTKKIFGRRYIRSIFNRTDAALASIAFPATVCIHAQKPPPGGGPTP